MDLRTGRPARIIYDLIDKNEESLSNQNLTDY